MMQELMRFAVVGPAPRAGQRVGDLLEVFLPSASGTMPS